MGTEIKFVWLTVEQCTGSVSNASREWSRKVWLALLFIFKDEIHLETDHMPHQPTSTCAGC